MPEPGTVDLARIAALVEADDEPDPGDRSPEAVIAGDIRACITRWSNAFEIGLQAADAVVDAHAWMLAPDEEMMLAKYGYDQLHDAFRGF
jgi:hypothetical protein